MASRITIQHSNSKFSSVNKLESICILILTFFVLLISIWKLINWVKLLIWPNSKIGNNKEENDFELNVVWAKEIEKRKLKKEEDEKKEQIDIFI